MIANCDDGFCCFCWHLVARSLENNLLQSTFSKKLSEKHEVFLSNISIISVPKTIQDALSNRDWSLAIKEDMDRSRKVELGKLLIYQEIRTVGCK